MNLRCGLQIFHNGTPVELLYEVKLGVWMVKPLFVVQPVRQETFRDGDSFTKLHTYISRREV